MVVIVNTSTTVAQDYIWARNTPTNSDNFNADLSIDNIGNIFTVGKFEDTANFDPGITNFTLSKKSNGKDNAYIAKYNSSGNFLWAFGIGNNESETRMGSCSNDLNGNIAVTGYYNDTIDIDPGFGIQFIYPSFNFFGDLFIASYDSTGDLNWGGEINSAGSGGTGEGIITDIMSNVIVAGTFNSSIDADINSSVYTLTSSSLYDGFLTKYSSNGFLKWAINSRGLSATDECNFRALTLGEFGSIYVGGEFTGNIDFDPSSNTYLLNSGGNQYAFIAKYDSSGNFIWVKGFGGTSDIWANSIDIDQNEIVYLTGTFGGTIDFDPGPDTVQINRNLNGSSYITCFDRYGNHQWAKSYIKPGISSEFRQIRIGQDNNIYIDGWHTGNNDFDPSDQSTKINSQGTDAFFASYDSLGNFHWVRSIGGIGGDRAGSLELDAVNNIYVGGYFTGQNVDLNPGLGIAFFTGPNPNSFVAKYGPCALLHSKILDTICQGEKYIFADGDFTFQSAIDTSVISSSGGCDSMVITQLHVKELNNAISFNKGLLKSEASNAQYQWLSCDSLGYTAIFGETNREFTPTINGKFAVQVTVDGCTDTSDCFEINWIGISEADRIPKIEVYPIPASDQLTVNSDFNIEEYRILNMQGVLVQKGQLRNSSISVEHIENGIYLLELRYKDAWVRKKIMIRR